jgi:hypothetical protein
MKILILKISIAAAIGMLFESTLYSKESLKVNIQDVDPLLVGIYLSRPEVVEKCLNEIARSPYEFVWHKLEAEEIKKASVNTKLTLTASLLGKETSTRKPKTGAIMGQAKLIVGRNEDALKKGELMFNCDVEYKLGAHK